MISQEKGDGRERGQAGGYKYETAGEGEVRGGAAHGKDTYPGRSGRGSTSVLLCASNSIVVNARQRLLYCLKLLAGTRCTPVAPLPRFLERNGILLGINAALVHPSATREST